MRETIPFYQFKYSPFALWDNEWFLLASGDLSSGNFNCMTISWGSMGIMWNKPFVQVVVRPGRYTYGFMEKYSDFTLSHFAREYRPALQLLGSRSGRDGNKIKDSGLTPTPSLSVAAPSFEEADLVIECKKIYAEDFNPAHFFDPIINTQYPQSDFHRQYFGEIVSISGSNDYK